MTSFPRSFPELGKTRLLLTAAAFFVFLVAGFQTTSWLFNLVGSRAGPLIGGSQAVRGVKDILLIVADDLQSDQPRLRSVWAIRLDTSGPVSLIFTPIETGSEKGHPLAEAFSLKDGIPVDKFMTKVRQLRVSWDSYVVLDQQSLMFFVQWFAGKEAAKTFQSKLAVRSYSVDRRILEMVCDHLTPEVDQPARVIPWSKIAPQRFVTNEDFSNVVENWNVITNGEVNPVCIIKPIKK